MRETIVKYQNRKLYSYETAGYVSLEYIADRWADGIDFKIVLHAENGPDITAEIVKDALISRHKDNADFSKYILSYPQLSR